MFIRKRSKLQCFKGEGENKNVSKETSRLQRLKGEGPKKNICKSKVRITMIKRIKSELQYL